MKKKLDTRFPAARIKKIMQSDEDVGKIAMAVPLLVSKALELFLQDLCDRTYKITLERGAKTVSSLHLKQCVQSFNMFDFLKEIVREVPDLGGASAGGDDRSLAKRRKVDNENHYGDESSKGRIMHDTDNTSNSGRGCGRGRGRGRGRPRATEGRASARYDKYEDDPDLHDTIHELKPSSFMPAMEKDNAKLMDPNRKMETSIRNFDLNIELDENGDSTAMSAAAPVSTDMKLPEVMHKEYPGWALGAMDNMAIDPVQLVGLNPVQLVSLNQRMNEDDDYDDEG